MKLPYLSTVAALALCSSAAHSERWIQYEIQGSGYFDSVSSEWEEVEWNSGKVKFSGYFIVNLDTGEGELPYFSDAYYQGDGSFYQERYNDGVNETTTLATTTSSGLSLDYSSGECSTYTGCENWTVSLNFAPSSLTGLPAYLPKLHTGVIGYYSQGRYSSLEADGAVLRVTATEVSGPGGAGMSLALSTPSVPEISSWMMMLGGFALVGGAMRVGRGVNSPASRRRSWNSHFQRNI